MTGGMLFQQADTLRLIGVRMPAADRLPSVDPMPPPARTSMPPRTSGC